MKKFSILLCFCFFISCSNLQFVFSGKENLVNPLYDKTKVEIKGKDLPFIKSYVPMFFGSNEKEEYYLSINIEEKQTKRSVETNQAISNLRYELRFIYVLESKLNKCVTYKKEILSSFSIIPKSSGYNYGSDISLENKYELAVSENLNRFIALLSGLDLNDCV